MMMPSSLHPYSIVKEQINHLLANGNCLGAIPHLILVEMSGFEPPTPCVQGRCSPAELHPHFRLWISDCRLRISFNNSAFCIPPSTIIWWAYIVFNTHNHDFK